jgi:hypothetical protein
MTTAEPATTEAAETVSETPTESVEAAEPVEAVEAEPVEAAEESIDAPEETVPAVYDWNGELDALKGSDWFASLDDPVKNAVLQGLETKHNHWQRGYNDKFKEMSAGRRKLDLREKDVRDQEIRVQRWLNGDVDPLAEKQKEIDELKTMHRSAMETLRNEFDETTRKAQEASQSELQEIIKERESLRQAADARKQLEAEAAEKEMDAAVREFDSWLEETASDIKSNPEAHNALVALIMQDIDPRDAVGMVRQKWPLPQAEPEPTPEPAPEPEPVPDGVDMMNMGAGSSGTETGEHRSIEDILDGMRRSAQLDATTVMGLKS